MSTLSSGAVQVTPPANTFTHIIQTIPPGWVMSYGAIAKRAGHPRHARQVGWLVAHLPEDSTLPWWRVVNSRGEIPLRGDPPQEAAQRQGLIDEGVQFDVRGRIDLRVFSWPG